MMQNILIAVLSIAALTAAQYFPPTPEGVTTVQSKTHEGVSISFKEVRIVTDLTSKVSR